MLRNLSKEAGLLALADATQQDFNANAEVLRAGRQSRHPRAVATWFLPVVTHALKGGVRTAFMLAQEFSQRWGTLNVIVIYSHSGANVDVAPLSESLRQHFPDLRFVVSVFRRGKDHESALPASDFAFCTMWTTAYLLLKYNRTRAKYYLMQDFEPRFYAAGGVYGAIEHTYRFGFTCIANTPGVGDLYRSYSDDVVSFLPGVDGSTFHPDPEKQALGSTCQVVFYGRPSNARNCFDLGVSTLFELKKRMGAQVRILSVGEEWDPATFGLEGVVENLGLLGSMEEVAQLYRESDLGLVYMMTPHPSYQPLEYMASGCVVATNINEANGWLLNDDNALLIAPIAQAAAQRIEDLLSNPVQWSSLRQAGLRSAANLAWKTAFDTVCDRIASG